MPKLKYNLDPDSLNTSYSMLGVLHECPRKFQITQINGRGRQANGKSIIFGFGHAVGAGIQSILAGDSLPASCISALAAYDVDDLWEVHKSKRSIGLAWLALEKFVALKLLSGWQVARFFDAQGVERSGIEFAFLLRHASLRANYQGHVDVILYHPVENIFMVLEIKTTSWYKESSYRNSNQTLGYSLVVDYIVDNCSGLMDIADPDGAKASNKILYLVFDIKNENWELLPLLQTSLAKAEFIQSVMLDWKHIREYQEINFFPKNGAACSGKFNECELYGVCDLSSMLTPAQSSEQYDDGEVPAIILDIEDVLQHQLAKTSEEVFQSANVMPFPEINLGDMEL